MFSVQIETPRGTVYTTPTRCWITCCLIEMGAHRSNLPASVIPATRSFREARQRMLAAGEGQNLAIELVATEIDGQGEPISRTATKVEVFLPGASFPVIGGWPLLDLAPPEAKDYQPVVDQEASLPRETRGETPEEPRL